MVQGYNYRHHIVELNEFDRFASTYQPTQYLRRKQKRFESDSFLLNRRVKQANKCGLGNNDKLGIKVPPKQFLGSREHELKVYQGTSGFIKGIMGTCNPAPLEELRYS